MSDGEWEVRTTGCKRGSVMHCITQRVQPTVNNNCNWKIKSSKFIYKFKISKARNIFFCRNQCLEGSFFMVSSSLFPFFFFLIMPWSLEYSLLFPQISPWTLIGSI